MADARHIVGIDLGTTHTVVASAPADGSGDPQVFDIPQLVTSASSASRPLLPSLLYAALESEAVRDPWGEPPWVKGELARRRGAEVPGRLVTSAKSWLCHAGVDRTAAILPWGAESDVPKISPCDASAAFLGHVRRAWDEAHPDAPLSAQEVVLTVPASFDEAARELTLVAAERAGLGVRLLEEPQAAFYDYRARAGDGALARLLEAGDGSALVLVCDVGGGTTDLSLLRVQRPSGREERVDVTRVAVGRHLLLGGDNMDLALAHSCEARLGDVTLDPARYGQLVLACRAAKEALLADDAPVEVGVSVAAAGSRLVGSTLRARVTRDEALAIVLEGFFPQAPAEAEPVRARGGLVGFGLPYERDVAITRHVAAFFRRHAEGALAPRAVLLNGGVFHSPRIAERLVRALDAWGGPPVVVLPHAEPDLAVARGAVSYGLSRRRGAATISSGSARGYYVEVAAKPPMSRAVVCVVPRGAEEGAVQVASGAPLALVVGRPARFDLHASDNARGHRAGDVLAWSDVDLDPLPPLFASFEESTPTEGSVRVAIQGELTAIGTLDLACVELDPPAGRAPRRFRLAFRLRDEAQGRGAAPSVPPTSRLRGVQGRPLEDACAAIDRVFGKSARDVAPREVKDLIRELERLLGERGQWDTATTRTLFDAVARGHRARRRSLDHERVFWQLAGYCLRPGAGDPLDGPRVAALVRLLPEKIAFTDQVRGWQQFWFAWRRVAAGLDEPAEVAIRDLVDPFLAPAEAARKRPKGWKPDALDAMLEMASSLERVPVARRTELGSWIVERTWTDRDPRLWAALGRLGARVPAYASVSYVVRASSVERWLDHLLREKWGEVPTAAEAALRMARVTGDRVRDVPERLRREVAQRLTRLGTPPEQVRTVTEFVEVEERDRAAFFGEGMPVGLRLVG
jgi:molecular chaperone DnaK (HSP70)